jgi:hypothetical protein
MTCFWQLIAAAGPASFLHGRKLWTILKSCRPIFLVPGEQCIISDLIGPLFLQVERRCEECFTPRLLPYDPQLTRTAQRVATF